MLLLIQLTEIHKSQYCCGGLFADDTVLVAPSKQALKKILNKVHVWAIKDEMTFGINKSIFFIGSNKLPKYLNFTYLGIPFDESLSLKPNTIQIKHLVLYYAPLFGSNKSRCSKAQKIINRGLYWSYGFKCRNSYVSLYDITRELRIPLLSTVCAISQLRCFRKWKNSSCIINHLTNKYSYYKLNVLLGKVFKPSKAKKAIIYMENNLGFISEIKDLTFQYPKYQLGFFWISLIRCGFKFDIISGNCPKFCPCCGVSVPSFSHWIFAYKELENYRNKSLPFLDDLFLKFEMVIKQKSLDISLDSERDYDNNIYYFILSALLGGQLVDNIFKQSSTSSTVPYFVGIAEFLTNVIPLICRSFRLMMKWYGFSPHVERSDTDSFNNTNSEIITPNNGRGVIIDEWGKYNNQNNDRIYYWPDHLYEKNVTRTPHHLSYNYKDMIYYNTSQSSQAYWLRSSVVSVLFSVTTETRYLYCTTSGLRREPLMKLEYSPNTICTPNSTIIFNITTIFNKNSITKVITVIKKLSYEKKTSIALKRKFLFHPNYEGYTKAKCNCCVKSNENFSLLYRFDVNDGFNGTQIDYSITKYKNMKMVKENFYKDD
ncbi:hypothetical protein H8356DRAFT_1341342 [Neocallimastix lanati (nom. inval.)]|nr:hypothetical protein H8356DRAFT_1341342 [Neocallimastix sp. JGI-2020a]